MKTYSDENTSQCHNELKNKGFTQVEFPLPAEVLKVVKEKNFSKLDDIFKKLLRNGGDLYNFLTRFTDETIHYIEHIISLREAINPWEENGIWHDDGSRVLAFSLSLTLGEVGGGVLEFRKKGKLDSFKIKTPDFGVGIIFKTGHEDFEHKINKVSSGSRLIIAGWLYNESQISSA